MQRSLLVLALAACGSSGPPLQQHANPPPPVARAPAALCCCESSLVGDAGEREHWESRETACKIGTPTLPNGTCVDWSRCGFPTGARRTVADRPELAAKVDVPAGSCCCDADNGFAVVETSRCTDCLDEDWCVPRKPPPPPPHTVTAPGVDRCVLVADHFEPWRKNPDWAAEVSPRAQLIADCHSKKWSVQLQDCLLAANSPLDLDQCVNVP